MYAASPDQPPLTATAAAVECVLGVRAATLRQWVSRGQVRKHGRDRYDVADILARLAGDPR